MIEQEQDGADEEPQGRSGTRSSVLDAAAAAFMQRGYSATSIVDIADQLGATKGRVYHWYRSKAEIYLDVHLQALHMLIDAIEPIASTDEPPEQRLEEMVRAHALMMMRNYTYQGVAMQSYEMRTLDLASSALREARTELIRLRDRYEQFFADVIEEGVASGYFRKMDGRLGTKPLLGASNWITRWYDPERGDPVGDAVIADEMATFAIQGLRVMPVVDADA